MKTNPIKLLDIVALVVDLPEYKLLRGQVGTVVETLADGKAFEVEFSDRDGRTYELQSDDIVFPEDTLQMFYHTKSAGYLAILSRDGAGVVSRYFDDEQGNAVAVMAGFEQSVPHSIILDDTLGRETIRTLFCPTAFVLAPLTKALERDQLAAPPGCSLDTFVIDKRLP